MIHFLETIGVLKKESNVDFKIAPAILMLLLMVTFLGSIIYVLISSINY